MPPDRNDVLELCEHLVANEDIRLTVKEAGKGALIAGAGAGIGALLFGPMGLAIGGTAGSVTAACWSRDKFKSAYEVIKNDLSYADRERLAICVQRVLGQIDSRDVIMLIGIVMSSNSLKEVVLREVVQFLTNDLSYRIQN